MRRWLFTSRFSHKSNTASGWLVARKRMKGTIDYEPLTKEIRQLQMPEGRSRTGNFCVEGIRFVYQARWAKAQVKRVIVCDPILSSDVGRRLVRELESDRIAVTHVPPEVFYALSRSQEAQGILVVVAQRWLNLSEVKVKSDDLWVALEEVLSPGNLGTAICSADAVGARGLLLTNAAVDPFDPGCVRATMGSIFALEFVKAPLDLLGAWRKRHGLQLIGSSPNAQNLYTSISLKGPTILYMGGERKGLSPIAFASCDQVVRIPMVGTADSLNLGVAASLMLYEAFNSRRQTRFQWNV